VEAQYCLLARTTERLTTGGKEFQLTLGTTVPFWGGGDLKVNGECSTGVIEMATGQKLGGTGGLGDRDIRNQSTRQGASGRDNSRPTCPRKEGRCKVTAGQQLQAASTYDFQSVIRLV
jgi:hypothetical protein